LLCTVFIFYKTQTPDVIDIIASEPVSKYKNIDIVFPSLLTPAFMYDDDVIENIYVWTYWVTIVIGVVGFHIFLYPNWYKNVVGLSTMYLVQDILFYGMYVFFTHASLRALYKHWILEDYFEISTDTTINYGPFVTSSYISYFNYQSGMIFTSLLTCVYLLCWLNPDLRSTIREYSPWVDKQICISDILKALFYSLKAITVIGDTNCKTCYGCFFCEWTAHAVTVLLYITEILYTERHSFHVAGWNVFMYAALYANVLEILNHVGSRFDIHPIYSYNNLASETKYTQAIATAAIVYVAFKYGLTAFIKKAYDRGFITLLFQVQTMIVNPQAVHVGFVGYPSGYVGNC